jgi:hypothetical protein
MLLAHDVLGSGPLAVVVHGITESRESTRPLAEGLASNRTVVTVDLRGHGASGLADSYRMDEAATDIHETLLSIGFTDADRPLVVGHSLGGVVATAYGALFPTRGVVDIDQVLTLGDFKANLEAIEPILRGSEEGFQQLMLAFFDPMYGALGQQERDRLAALRTPVQSVVLGYWSVIFEETTEQINEQIRQFVSRIRVPYLALFGSDPGSTYEAWLAQQIPGALTEVWEAHGHYPHLVDLPRCISRVNAFDPV